MKYGFTLLLLAGWLTMVFAQTERAHAMLSNRIHGIGAGSSATEVPLNYKDYYFTWDAATSTWDSSNIDIAEFWGTAENINMRISTRVRENDMLVDGNWIETYRANLEQVDLLDPLEPYTYFPGDSVHAVIDAPYLGIFPLSSYYTSTGDGKLETEVSFYNSTLLGEPGGYTLWLGGSKNYYDGNGSLTAHAIQWEGMDSTLFYYRGDGSLERSVELIGYYSGIPEEYIETVYGYDDQERLGFVVTTYFLDSLETIDFRDSVAYTYGNGRNYRKSTYYSDPEQGMYALTGAIDYNFDQDTVEIMDVLYVFAGNLQITERSISSYDQDGNFLRRLTQKAFFPDTSLANSALVVRAYDEKTVGVQDRFSTAAEWLDWREEGSDLILKWASPREGTLYLVAMDGQRISSNPVFGTEGSLWLPELPAAVYYLVFVDADGHVIGTKGIYLQ